MPGIWIGKRVQMDRGSHEAAFRGAASNRDAKPSFYIDSILAEDHRRQARSVDASAVLGQQSSWSPPPWLLYPVMCPGPHWALHCQLGHLQGGTMATVGAQVTSPDAPPRRPRKPRTPRRSRPHFSFEQLQGLGAAFTSDRYPSLESRKSLATLLGLSPAQVKSWFQNQRVRSKKMGMDQEAEQVPLTSICNTSFSVAFEAGPRDVQSVQNGGQEGQDTDKDKRTMRAKGVRTTDTAP
uniref:brain-specific homeobox protein homolog n=1 Tax=Myxine glutinosa TaxID=7769 RepID=UPI00358E7503